MKNGTVLLICVMALSGCVNTQPNVAKDETIQTTKEVLIPHDDNIKKAVAVLIYKVNNLEASNKMLLEQSKVSFNENSESKLIRDKLFGLEQRVSELSNKTDEAIATSATSNNNFVVKEAETIKETSEYDAIIKDFANEGSLK